MAQEGSTGLWRVGGLLMRKSTAFLSNAGAPTNGPSGTGAGKAGPGSLYFNATTGLVYVNTNTKASPTWTLLLSAASQLPITALAVNGAISPGASAVYAITKAGVLADTLAAPAASPGGDGFEILIISDTANAHTITATGLLDTGSAFVNVATFNANKGASLELLSYNARWKVTFANGVSFS